MAGSNKNCKLILSFFGLTLIVNSFLLFNACNIREGTNKKDADKTFKNITSSAGLRKTTASNSNPILVDFNNDDYIDLLVQHKAGTFSLYQNLGNETFQDISDTSGIVPLSDKDRHGAAWGDYDNDGNIDLFITKDGCDGTCPNDKSDELWKGDGKGRFVNVTVTAEILNASGRGRSPFWIDYNNDGLLDLFILNYKNGSVLYENNGNGTFSDVTKTTRLSNINGLVCSWADYNNDGAMDILITGDDNYRLFRNNPILHAFTDVTSSAGLLSERGLGISWGDYNNDGYNDIYISRGVIETDNTIIIEQNKILFKDEKELGSGLDFTTTGENVTFELLLNNKPQPEKVYLGSGRVNPKTNPFIIESNDPSVKGAPSYLPGGETGIFIWKDELNVWHIFYNSNGTLNYYYGNLISDGIFAGVKPAFSPVYSEFKFKDTLYKNNGDGTFTDVTDLSGVSLSGTGNHLSSSWGDYDNDGYLDLYVVDAGDISGSKPNILYKNNGDGTFTDTANKEGVEAGNNTIRHYGAAWGDFNNDGRLDLFLKNGAGEKFPLASGPNMFYKNITGNENHWLKIKLIGTKSNRNAIGAKVTISVNGKIQYREVNSTPIHFGLGSNTIVDEIVIKWPSGVIQTLAGITADKAITIFEESQLGKWVI